MANPRSVPKSHIYVLDTCVLLHDPTAIYKFNNNDIYIPLAVIDDLDEQKTRPGSVGWSAREVFRILDDYDLKEMTDRGAKVNDAGGKLFIYNGDSPLAKHERPAIVRVNSDNAMIETAHALQAQFPNRKVTIVTKDTGLRVRAASWKCLAENYRADLLDSNLYTGIRYVKKLHAGDSKVLSTKDVVNLTDFSKDVQHQLEGLSTNEFVIFGEGEDYELMPYIYRDSVLTSLKGVATKKNKNSWNPNISPKNVEQICAMYALAHPDIKMISLAGAAGTGKTLLTLAVALDLINQGHYSTIVVIKPLIPVGGKDIGALPGDKFEKISQWLGPIRDNISQIVGKHSMKSSNTFQEMVEDGIIEVEAMQFIQGRSIPDSIVIIDEAENLTPRECRMAVERVAKESKIILLGDLSQVENPYLDSHSCGLSHAIAGGKGHDMCSSVTLRTVERSSLASIASEIFSSPVAYR